jgi:peptidoglycan glycosyltransferase
MNGGIKRVGWVMIILFLALVAQLTYLQVGRATNLADDSRNSRKFLNDVSRNRGPIVSSDGVILALSVPKGDEYKYQRVYPPGTATAFAHVVGYQSIQFGSVGVERAYSSDLTGRTFKLQTSDLAGVLANRQPVGTVVLTLSNAAQQAAIRALNNERGTVVALDVKTGGVLAAYSNPTFDPNPLVSHDSKTAKKYHDLYLLNPTNPLLARPWREIYPPGSTFKTVTASATLDANVDVDKQFPVVRQIPLPLTTATLQNFGTPPELCGGSLEASFIVSCNTTYGQVGLDLGDRFAEALPNFGVQTAPPHTSDNGIDPAIVPSAGPKPGTFKTLAPTFAQAAIGQNAVAVTPMEMALVAEGVATGGSILQPTFVQCVKDPEERVVKRVGTTEYKRAMSPETAATMKQFMLGVVNDPKGTGTAAQIPGIAVAGKTGTAETAQGEAPHAWFIAFAPANDPQVAVAVLVEHGGQNGQNAEATGGRVAAPIAKQVLQALLAPGATKPQCGSGQQSNSTNGG